MISILRDKSVTPHESTDKSLSFQEGETGKTEKIAWSEDLEAGTQREPRRSRFHYSPGCMRDKSTSQTRKEDWGQIMEGFPCQAEECRLESRGNGKW